jgi:hypothetical protein
MVFGHAPPSQKSGEALIPFLCADRHNTLPQQKANPKHEIPACQRIRSAGRRNSKQFQNPKFKVSKLVLNFCHLRFEFARPVKYESYFLLSLSVAIRLAEQESNLVCNYLTG